MGMLAILGVLGGLMLGSMVLSDDSDVSATETDTPEDPDEPEIPSDTGASFEQTENGVEIELGEDETRSLAVIHFVDTQDDDENFIAVDEARFYLVPEDVDWSGASWETRDDVPGLDEFEVEAEDYNLAQFEEQLGLELLGTVDLMGVPSETDDPDDRVGEITSNAPYESFYLEAETDGDYLYSFLPEDYVITRNGVPELSVTEDTTGTEGYDWLSADADGIRVDGAGGDDDLETESADVTLVGGEGDDTFTSNGSDGAVVNGGDGDDLVNFFGSTSATIDLGAGDDRARFINGTAWGGEGDDSLSVGSSSDNFADAAPGIVYGQAGNDNLPLNGTGTEGFGGVGDDFLSIGAEATGYGGQGNDHLQIYSGGTGFGGDGDDLLVTSAFLNDDDGTVIATGGAGADTFQADIRSPFNGEPDTPYMRITDFDADEDVLQMSASGFMVELDTIEILTAQDGSHTDLRLTYASASSGFAPGTAVIRLDGVTEFTEDQIVIGA